jgi:Cu/Ag efflux pump CusA
VGEGGEQNAPLGRAVIGGLTFATVATLTLLPYVYSRLREGRARPALQSVSASDDSAAPTPAPVS